jgi:hypothetical protein
MSGFLEAFFPNLAATILGVVFGLPAALYVNARLTASQRRQQLASEVMRRNLVVDVLNAACTYNIQILTKMGELALTARVMRNPDLQTTTWDSVGPILSAECSDPLLVHQLSHHWLRLRRLEQLNDDLFRREIGALPPVEGQDMMIGMWQELHDSSVTLASHAAEFSERLIILKSAVKRSS